jgi:hypothetical protein
MARASSSPNSSSSSPSSTFGCSLGTIIVPLDFRDVIFGRLRGSWGLRGLPSSWTEEDEEEVEEVDLGMSTTVAAGSFTVGS